jgi:hypothetical protein
MSSIFTVTTQYLSFKSGEEVFDVDVAKSSCRLLHSLILIHPH